jgi:hypothetical protein
VVKAELADPDHPDGEAQVADVPHRGSVVRLDPRDRSIRP